MKFSDLQLATPYLALNSLFFDEVNPIPLAEPFIISTSQDAGKLLGIDRSLFDDEKLLEIVNGSLKLEGSQTFAMCYAGHQFGHFVPRLGDGRAVLRSSIREYLMSEAMHGLGIKTSRAIALIGSNTDVHREGLEKGAIVLRISPTWVRFGTFEYFNAHRELAMIQELADYVMAESFPHLVGEEGCYLKMYAEIVKNTAKTIAGWQSVGFNHGVMNTDNMSIDGRTIDYGPFAFLDDYDSSYICNHTDKDGRYSFKNQPGVAKWNLQRLAMAISPIANNDAAIEILNEVFEEAYKREYLERMSKRLGLFQSDEEDEIFIQWMLRSLSSATIDFNLFFRILSVYDGNKSSLLDITVTHAPLEEWLDAYDKRLNKETLSQEQRHKKMLAVNPKYILKNHILQLAIEQTRTNDFTMINDLLTVALSPCEEHKELEYLCIQTPQKKKNIKLSCSS